MDIFYSPYPGFAVLPVYISLTTPAVDPFRRKGQLHPSRALNRDADAIPDKTATPVLLKRQRG